MLAWFKYLNLVPMLIGLITSVVHLVEGVRAHAAGADKKAAVMEAIAAAWAGLGVKAEYAAVEPIISTLVDLAVSVYNAVGHFTHADATAAAPVEVTPGTPIAAAAVTPASGMSPVFDSPRDGDA